MLQFQLTELELNELQYQFQTGITSIHSLYILDKKQHKYKRINK